MAQSYNEELNRLLNETTEYLNEVEYPAHKRDLVAAAAARDAPAPVLTVLEKLPEKTYASHDDLVALFAKADDRPTRRESDMPGFGLFRFFEGLT